MVQRREDRGHVPLRSRHKAEERPASQPIEDVATADPSRRTSILVVEDDVALLSFYKSGLMLAGFAVTTAANGIDALHRIEEDPPDLIVLDLGLPLLSGLDVLREITSDARTRHIPILVVTGQPDVELAGFACVLQKPVTADALVTAVENFLSRRA
jgi:DNA-binding response OmpR family regulator